MRIIVPLAGPDFIIDESVLKAEIEINGVPLLHRVLNSRPWASSLPSQHYSFILHDCSKTRNFAKKKLQKWYPGSTITFLSNYTRGAALSALAGMATGLELSEPIIIDLADILYISSLDPIDVFARNPTCNGIALVFKSDNCIYSYLRTDQFGSFVEAAEKRVISDNASAGTYIFRNFSTYLRALANELENEEGKSYQSLFYVCPLFNGVKAQGRDVILEEVNDVEDIKFSQY